jgi:DNA-binding NarL/FixJ family response regulator
MHSPTVLLLVEDNAGDILLIRQILLKSSTPVRLHVAMDGEQALQMLADAQFKPDLIILDLNLPKIPGLALLEKCKPSAPVVVFSSSANPAEVKEAMDLGVRGFVRKPSDLEEFAKAIIKMILDWGTPKSSGAACGTS